MDKAEEVLLTAIAIERYGQEYYGKFADILEDKDGKSLMLGLKRDEAEHEEMLSGEFKARIGKTAPKKISLEIGAKAVKEIFASMRKGKMSAEMAIEILEVGIMTEKKSVDYYSRESKKAKDAKLRKLLDQLVEIERGHKKLLEENVFHLRQDGSWWGYVPILEG